MSIYKLFLADIVRAAMRPRGALLVIVAVLGAVVSVSLAPSGVKLAIGVSSLTQLTIGLVLAGGLAAVLRGLEVLRVLLYQVKELEDRATAFENSVQRLDKLDASTAESVQRIDKLDASTAESVQRIYKLDASTAESVQRIYKLDASTAESVQRIDKLDASTAESVQRIYKLDASTAESVQRIDKLDASTAESVQRIDKLDATTAEQTRGLHELESTRSELQDCTFELARHVASIEGRLQTCQSDQGRLEGQLGRLQDISEGLELVIGRMEAKTRDQGDLFTSELREHESRWSAGLDSSQREIQAHLDLYLAKRDEAHRATEGRIISIADLLDALRRDLNAQMAASVARLGLVEDGLLAHAANLSARDAAS